MSELVDKDAFLKQERKWYCENCDMRKGVKNGRKCFVYEIGEVPCRACDVDDVLDDLEDFPTASPWHRVEEEMPKMSAIVPGYVCSDILVLCDAESGYMDIGYVREKPDNNGVDWLWGKPLKSPTHWMPIEPPKDDNNG